MELGVGVTVWFDRRPGVVVEGPDEGGQFLIEFTRGDGGLDTVWCAPGDARVQFRTS